MRDALPTLGLLLALLASLASSRSAHAQAVYRCVAKDGAIAFQDRPCAGGSAERRIDIATKDPPRIERAPAQARDRDKPTRGAGSPRRLRVAEPASHECRTDTGMVFYRHGRCPSTLAATSTSSGKGKRVAVHSQSMPRSEACRRMRNLARDGDELDERPSTYERNLGRDICRDY